MSETTPTYQVVRTQSKHYGQEATFRALQEITEKHPDRRYIVQKNSSDTCYRLLRVYNEFELGR